MRVKTIHISSLPSHRYGRYTGCIEEENPFGMTKALTSIVATIVSSYSLIPAFLGIIVLRERLVRVQEVGIVAILVGFGILAIGTS